MPPSDSRAGALTGRAVLVCAALTIAGHYASGDWRWLHYLFKPLTTALIFAAAFRANDHVDERYRTAVLAGIAFSLIGDVFLMLDDRFFVVGLLCFLVAHVCYLVAFTTQCQLGVRRLPFLVLGVIGLANLATLWPSLAGGLRIPVVVYVAMLVAMASQAVARALRFRTSSSRVASLGGVLFLASDTVLAHNKFGAPFRSATLLVLATYYAAQWAIAQSVRESITGSGAGRDQNHDTRVRSTAAMRHGTRA